MNAIGTVKLKKGKEVVVWNRHPWIFSGAVGEVRAEDGQLVKVFNSGGIELGCGYYNSKTSIQVRMLSFAAGEPSELLSRNLKNAVQRRAGFFGGDTNAYRIVNAEGDDLPGLIVDKYNDELVVQIGTLGMENLRGQVIDILNKELSPACIFEKSNMPSRIEEGLKESEGLLSGSLVEEVRVLENGISFKVKLKGSQKTGIFIDQREMRALLGALSKDKSVFNCFCYTAGFSLYAKRSQAKRVLSLDSSASAIEQAKENFSINNFSVDESDFVVADAFKYLHETNDTWDIVVLDPPAFAKKRSHIESAKRGYFDINRQGLRLVKDGGYLLTCSCSYYLEERDLEETLFKAGYEAKRPLRIIQRHRQAMDHPESIFHPEGRYLKSFLVEVG